MGSVIIGVLASCTPDKCLWLLIKGLDRNRLNACPPYSNIAELNS